MLNIEGMIESAIISFLHSIDINLSANINQNHKNQTRNCVFFWLIPSGLVFCHFFEGMTYHL